MSTSAFGIERVYLASHIRRGRQATSPTWQVRTGGFLWRFQRMADAVRFVATGAECPSHEPLCCRNCRGQRSLEDA